MAQSVARKGGPYCASHFPIWVIFRLRGARELGPPFPQQQTCDDCFGMSERCQQETSPFGNGRVFRLHGPGQKFQHQDTARLSDVAKNEPGPGENTAAEPHRPLRVLIVSIWLR